MVIKDHLAFLDSMDLPASKETGGLKGHLESRVTLGLQDLKVSQD
jgi:hypothetical protein